ncbi:aspartic proteinase nepenthesin-2-like [Papaver somniferum]|uniref:aspartic proteinase nepenthesin-2-like n=1 Tax=Papaver somniferum TaxID=3469 RepID=UPI000E6F5014|nr:aspartic proteinase nepenthesin-2-like [Papaver somniferum]XP_026428974.1 aspartic proteinase nepenthesin-2-like [Papaver somniferum]
MKKADVFMKVSLFLTPFLLLSQPSDSRLLQSNNTINTLTFTLHHKKNLPLPNVTTRNFVNPVSYHRQDSYYIRFFIGSPRKLFLLVIDTGSPYTWVRCNPCDDCSTSEYFDYQDSTSFSAVICASDRCPSKMCGEHLECPFQTGYEDGSTTNGIWVADKFTLLKDDYATFVAMNDMRFGCASHTDAVPHLDGVLGMSRGSLSLVSSLEVAYGFTQFSYCLNPNSTTALTFGESIDDTGLVIYTPLVAHPQYYFVRLQGITIGSESIESTDFPIEMALDSGSTKSYFPTSLYNMLRDRYLGIVSALGWVRYYGSKETCYYASPTEVDKLPLANFRFDGDANLNLKPDNIWIPLHEQTEVVCLAFGESTNHAPIFGNAQQKQILMIHDFGRSRIGFLPAGC